MILTHKNLVSINPYLFDESDLEDAIVVLKRGGVVIHPTETVYGLAAVWNDETALRRVASLKKRSLEKPFSILVNGTEQVLRISGWDSARLEILLKKIFPAPLTILLPRQVRLSTTFWNQFPEIGFRFPDFKLCNSLVEMAGKPLITTSANIADQPPPKTAAEIDESLIRHSGMFLNGGDCPLRIPSTVLRFNPDKQEMEVIREGAFPSERFEEIMQEVYEQQQIK
jgi:L-threonylcarbamoyladenylate synthase